MVTDGQSLLATLRLLLPAITRTLVRKQMPLDSLHASMPCKSCPSRAAASSLIQWTHMMTPHIVASFVPPHTHLDSQLAPQLLEQLLQQPHHKAAALPALICSGKVGPACQHCTQRQHLCQPLGGCSSCMHSSRAGGSRSSSSVARRCALPASQLLQMVLAAG